MPFVITSQRRQSWTLAAAIAATAAVCAFAFTGMARADQASAPAAALAPPSSIPVDTFFQRVDVASALLSPSGQRLTITTAGKNNHLGLYVFDLGETLQGRHVAQFVDADISKVRWVDEDRLVFSAVDLNSGSGEDYVRAPGLFLARVSKPGAQLLIDRQGKSFFVDKVERRPPLAWNHTLLMVPKSADGAEQREVLVGEMMFPSRTMDRMVPQWLNVDTLKKRSIELYDPARPCRGLVVQQPWRTARADDLARRARGLLLARPGRQRLAQAGRGRQLAHALPCGGGGRRRPALRHPLARATQRKRAGDVRLPDPGA